MDLAHETARNLKKNQNMLIFAMHQKQKSAVKY